MAAPVPTLETEGASRERTPPAKAEALALFGLVERGSSTVEQVRDLIQVSPADEARLRAFARAEPEYSDCVLEPLRYRKRVLREFDRLVHAEPERQATTQDDQPGIEAESEGAACCLLAAPWPKGDKLDRNSTVPQT